MQHQYLAEDYIQSESPQRSGTTYHDEHSTLKKQRSKSRSPFRNQFEQNRGTAGFGGVSEVSASQSRHHMTNHQEMGESPYQATDSKQVMDYGEEGEEEMDEEGEDEYDYGEEESL